MIPELRFSEFEDEWNIKKLGDITSYVDYRGRAPKKSSEGIFLVTAKNIRKGYIDYETSKEYVPIENYSEVMSKGLPQIGDILFTTEAPLGNICQVDNDKIALAQRVIKLRGNESLNNDYLLHYMLSFYYQKLINRMAFGTTVLGISGKALRKTKIKFPNPNEQTKIATFLTVVDKRINLLRKKKAELERYKKGVMQKLFSQTLRFKNDDGNDFPDWEEKKLGEVVLEYRLGGNYKNTNILNDYPLIKMGNLKRGKISTKKLEYISNSEDVQKVDRINSGDLFFNTRNTLDLVGKVAIWRNELLNAYYNSNLMYLKFENNCFMNYCLNSYLSIKKLRRIATGTTSVAAIYTKDLMRVKLLIPTLPEQKVIANFLSSIDKSIEKMTNQIDDSVEFKKGLLQKMFC